MVDEYTKALANEQRLKQIGELLEDFHRFKDYEVEDYERVFKEIQKVLDMK